MRKLHWVIVEPQKQQQKSCHFVIKKIRPHYIHNDFKTLISDNYHLIILVFMLISFFVSFSGISKLSHQLKTQLISTSEKIDFNGTIFPLKKTANWSDLSSNERSMNFVQLASKNKIVNLPSYNLSSMKNGLVWKPDNQKDRNTYITYPVPNLGNYELDASENSGSHPGIDIKAPVGTPVYAIANGLVVKQKNQSTGFGIHIVISHPNFPGYKNNILSAYAHLSKSIVDEMQVVKKGQIIGYVGKTGMATTPHLHFQIDTFDAPFHPYWPFSGKDLKRLKVSSYFEAVRIGVGEKKAKKYTIHGMNLVSKFIDYKSNDNGYLVANSSTSDSQRIVNTKKKTTTPPPEVKVVKKEIKKKSQKNKNTNTKTNVITNDKFKIAFNSDRSYIPNISKSVSITMENIDDNQDGYIVITSDLKNPNDIEISPNKISTKNLSKQDIKKINITSYVDRPFKLIAKINDKKFKSSTLTSTPFLDVSRQSKFFTAIKFLSSQRIIKGYEGGKFLPKKTINRAEATKILLLANKIEKQKQEINFTDINGDEWFADFISTAQQNNIIQGYSDKTFRPAKDISRVEFLKMAITAGQKTVNNLDYSAPYQDIKNNDWFAPYVNYSYQKKLINTHKSDFFEPAKPITREEASMVIYGLLISD